MKKTHPDAMLLFRNGNFYEMYKEDALKASVILALKVSDKILPLEKDPIKLLIFPHHELDKHLPKLVRSGERVAICDSLKSLVQQKEEAEKKNPVRKKYKKRTPLTRTLWRKRRKNRLCRKSLPRQSRRLQRKNLPRK